jgi:polysaccharide biosynthesis transport protein
MSQPAEPTPPEQAPVRSLALRGPHALTHPALRDERAAEIEDDGLDLRDLLRVVRKHKWMLLAVTLLCGVVAVVHSLRSTPMYRATALVQIDRTRSRWWPSTATSMPR